MEHDPPARARDVPALGPVVGRHVGVLPTDGRDSTGLLELEGGWECHGMCATYP